MIQTHRITHATSLFSEFDISTRRRLVMDLYRSALRGQLQSGLSAMTASWKRHPHRSDVISPHAANFGGKNPGSKIGKRVQYARRCCNEDDVKAGGLLVPTDPHD